MPRVTKFRKLSSGYQPASWYASYLGDYKTATYAMNVGGEYTQVEAIIKGGEVKELETAESVFPGKASADVEVRFESLSKKVRERIKNKIEEAEN